MAEYLYKVRPGDTVLSVCLAFDLTYDKFAQLNPDFNSMGHRYAGDLRVGERLIVGHSNVIIDRLRIEEKRKMK
jgi:hypothetical protein